MGGFDYMKTDGVFMLLDNYKANRRLGRGDRNHVIKGCCLNLLSSNQLIKTVQFNKKKLGLRL